MSARPHLASRIARLLVPLAWLLLVTAPALAQSGGLTITDETGDLDRAAVERAAQPLRDRGANVGVFLIESGGDSDRDSRTQSAGLGREGGWASDAIVIYVSYSPRISTIAYGEEWTAALRPNDNVGTIRQDQLNPGLAAGDPTRAVVNTLSAIERSIVAPPTSSGGTTIIEAPKTPEEIAAEERRTQLLVGGALGAVGFAVGGPVAYRSYRRRRDKAQAYAKARAAADEARRTAGGAVADMGQLLQGAREKAQYDKVSYSAPDVDQLAKLQTAAEERFVTAQERYSAAGDALALKREPAEADLQRASQEFAAVTQLVAEARAPLEQAEARRAELDKLGQAAPGEVDKAKKALADAAGRLEALVADFPQPDEIMRPLAALVERSESLLQERRAADAIQSAGAASAAIDDLNESLSRYADIREGISAGRAGAERAGAQGYHVDPGLAALNTAEGLLRQAAAALAAGGVLAAAPLLEQAEAARASGVQRGGGLPALRRANDERSEQVRQSGEQLTTYIAEGRQAFDMVDEFAESTWSDIRGNGSEAQAAADEATRLWGRARERNTMEAQLFVEAAADLDAAEERIGFARKLVDTIIQRLHDLEAARDAARDEIRAAQQDISAGREYVAANDPDVGRRPAEMLVKADTLLGRAVAMIEQPRPDWLAIVRDAQEANRLADAALTGARSEVGEMEKLRAGARRAQQVATAEVQKVVEFAGLHGNDLPPGSSSRIDGLRVNVQAAYTAIQNAEKAEEEARAAALRDAIERYTALERESQEVFGLIYAAFQRAEQLRAEVSKAMDEAKLAIQRAEQELARARAVISGRSDGVALLDEARSLYAAIGTVNGEESAQRAIQLANQARDRAGQAENFFEQQVKLHRPSGGVGPVIITGGWGGGGSGGRHGGGGSSGGGWGGGGGSSSGGWGGGGGSSGGWGGGGGGGGSSSGGW